MKGRRLQGGPLAAPTSCKWSYNPYEWPYKRVSGATTSISGVVTRFSTLYGGETWPGS